MFFKRKIKDQYLMGENTSTQPEEQSGATSSEESEQALDTKSQAAGDQDSLVIPDEMMDPEPAQISLGVGEIEQKEKVEGPAMQPPHGVLSSTSSVQSRTHAKKRSAAKQRIPHTNSAKLKVISSNKLWKIAGLTLGALTVVAIVIAGALGQYYKNKTMPNVSVAGRSMSGKSETDIKGYLIEQQNKLTVSFIASDTKLNPKLADIGLGIDAEQTVKNAMQAKRSEGVLARLEFWKTSRVPAVVTVNSNLLSQYVEANLPTLVKQPTDATLSFNSSRQVFSITGQASGEGPDLSKLTVSLMSIGETMKPKQISVTTAPKGPSITEKDLNLIIDQANSLVKRNVTLSGLGYTYRASPSDISSWITPTPKADGTVHLVIDSAKIQSYVGSIGKKISSAPQDTKIVKDDTTGQEVTLQEGRDGTELADQAQLASAIASGLAAGNDVAQTMNIQVASHKTVNMSSYDKWIEVDLSAQRTIAYEHATPVKTFIVATGVAGHRTVVGEFAIWHKVRSQTMQGGSKASGDYYSIPNVEWVSYFYQDYALHGAWWRKVFGYPASHGCVNMTNDDAHWVFDWAPIGTKVIVHE